MGAGPRSRVDLAIAEARVVVSPRALRERIAELAAEIDAAYPNSGVVFVGVLKGSLPFLADLARAVTVPVRVDFLSISSFEPEGGRVKVTMDLADPVEGAAVVLIEDLVDTGLTATFLLGAMLRRGAATVDVCTLLDKAARRLVPVPLRWVGFEVPDVFVLGYGLDFAGRYRNLDRVVAGDVDVLARDPDAYVAQLYGARDRRRAATSADLRRREPGG